MENPLPPAECLSPRSSLTQLNPAIGQCSPHVKPALPRTPIPRAENSNFKQGWVSGDANERRWIYLGVEGKGGDDVRRRNGERAAAGGVPAWSRGGAEGGSWRRQQPPPWLRRRSSTRARFWCLWSLAGSRSGAIVMACGGKG
jgi:hypothetical protein